MIRIRRGTSLLNKVVKQFDQAVADLEIAAKQIEAKRLATLEKVRATVERNKDRERALRNKHEAQQQKFGDKNVLAENKMYIKESELYAAAARAQAVSKKIAALVSA